MSIIHDRSGENLRENLDYDVERRRRFVDLQPADLEHIAELKDDNGQPMKDKDGQPIILRKPLEATYQVPGDEVHPGEDVVNEKGESWVMR